MTAVIENCDDTFMEYSNDKNVNTLSYLKKAGRAVDPMTQKTYNDIRGKR